MKVNVFSIRLHFFPLKDHNYVLIFFTLFIFVCFKGALATRFLWSVLTKEKYTIRITLSNTMGYSIVDQLHL